MGDQQKIDRLVYRVADVRLLVIKQPRGANLSKIREYQHDTCKCSFTPICPKLRHIVYWPTSRA